MKLEQENKKLCNLNIKTNNINSNPIKIKYDTKGDSIDNANDFNKPKITFEDDIDNDKERLLNKFNFILKTDKNIDETINIGNNKESFDNNKYIEKLKKKQLKYSASSTQNNSKLNTRNTSKFATTKNSPRNEEKIEKYSYNNKNNSVKSSFISKFNVNQIRHLSFNTKNNLKIHNTNSCNYTEYKDNKFNKSKLSNSIFKGKNMKKNLSFVDNKRINKNSNFLPKRKFQYKNNSKLNIKSKISKNEHLETDNLYIETTKNSIISSNKSNSSNDKSYSLKVQRNKNDSNFIKNSIFGEELLKIENLNYSLSQSQDKDNKNSNNNIPIEISPNNKLTFNRPESIETYKLNKNIPHSSFMSKQNNTEEVKYNQNNVNPFEEFYSNISDKKRAEVENSCLLDDEDYFNNKNTKLKIVWSNKKYEFIKEVKSKTAKIPLLSLKKFKEMKSNILFNIYSFLFENHKNMMNVSREFRNIFLDCMIDKYGYILDEFNKKYSSILTIMDHKYNIKKLRKISRFNVQTFSLNITTQIKHGNKDFKKNGDISFEIAYTYKLKNIKKNKDEKEEKEESEKEKIISNHTSNKSLSSYFSLGHIKEKYINIYKFDLRKNKNYGMWLYSDRDEVFSSLNKYSLNNLFNSNDNPISVKNIFRKNSNESIEEMFQNHIVFTSPVNNVNEDDKLIFRIDLIEDNHIVENINFLPLLTSIPPPCIFEYSPYLQSQKPDWLRDAEQESTIAAWHPNKYAEGSLKDFFDELKRNFGKNIDEINFDIMGKRIIKMKINASTLGYIKKNLFCNKNIKVVDKNDSIINECVPINCVQTFDMNKNICVKKGTKIIFYFEE